MIDNPTFGSDVLIEILLRLPVKQLCQLKTVSKQWLLIISSPTFKKLCNERSMRTPRLLIVEQSYIRHHVHNDIGPLSRTLHMYTMDIPTGVIHIGLSKDVPGRSYSFLSICNLFCYNNDGRYSIYNPTTHEHVHLPGASLPRSGFYCGYLQHTNEYKIVHISGVKQVYEDDKAVRFQILTLKDGEPIPKSWRIVEYDTPTWSYKPPSVSINCSIYWLVYSRTCTEKSIISIDLQTERFTTISCPEISPAPGYENYNHHEQLTEIKENLCLAHVSKEYNTLTMFVLKDHENHIWIKECSINLSNMDEGFTVVGYVPCDDNNADIIFHWYTGDLLSYNINERSFRRLAGSELPRRCHVSLYYDRLFSFAGR